MSEWSIQSLDPDRFSKHACLRVLLVVDSLYWTIGHFASQVANKNHRINAVICSQHAIREYQKRYGKFPLSFDLVHFLNTKSMDSFCGLVPTVITLHHMDSSTHLNDIENCDAVMTVSGQWCQYLLESGIVPERVGLVPFAVDSETFYPGSLDERHEIRHELTIADDAFVIGFSGRRTSNNDGRKGTDCLFEGMKKMRQAHSPLVTLLIGPGWEAFARRLHKEDIAAVHVPYQNNHHDIARLYRALDVYWVTSRIEGGPVPLLEAMASGVPCVSTPVGAALDLVQDQKNGFLVPFDCSDEFVNVTLTLVNNQDLVRRIGLAARETIMTERSWGQTQTCLAGLYETAIENFQLRRIKYDSGRVGGTANSSQLPQVRMRAVESFHDLELQPKQWIQACEYVRGAKMMLQLGEWRQATRLVGLALKEQPYDGNIWGQIVGILFSILKKKVWRRWINAKPRCPPTPVHEPGRS